MGNSSSQLSKEELSAIRAATKFNKDEFMQRYKAFLKECPSGKLNRPGFIKIYKEIFPFGDVQEFANYVFSVYDENEDNIIDFRELICGLNVTSRGEPKEKVEWTFQLYDLDENGVITYNELLQIIRSMYKMTGSMVELSPNEDTPEHWADKILDDMDRNHDRKITLDELTVGCLQHPKILQVLTIHNNFG